MDKTNKVRFFGDFTTGENYQLRFDLEQRQNILRQKGYDCLMDEVKEFFEDSYNIVNLESPITNAPKTTLEGKKAVCHWMDPVVAGDFMKKYGIDAVSLGNNHGYDYEHIGLVDSLNALDKANIKHFGAGLDINSARSPLIKTIQVGSKALNMYVFGGYKYREDYDKDFNFYAKENKSGVFLLTKDSITEDIKKIKNEDKDSLVVIFPHFGFDLQKTVPMQVESATSWIDAGADFVIGHGPHIMHKIEYYKNVPIIYSLGNFVFPANFRNRGIPYNLIFELEFVENASKIDIKQRLYPIFVDNNSNAPISRPIKESELDTVLEILIDKNNVVREKIQVNRGRIICIEL